MPDDTLCWRSSPVDSMFVARRVRRAGQAERDHSSWLTTARLWRSLLLGNPVLKTPNIDRLHGQSIRLTDFHVAPMMYRPARGQLMTGLDALRKRRDERQQRAGRCSAAGFLRWPTCSPALPDRDVRQVAPGRQLSLPPRRTAALSGRCVSLQPYSVRPGLLEERLLRHLAAAGDREGCAVVRLLHGRLLQEGISDRRAKDGE